MRSRRLCARRDGVAHTAAHVPSCVAIDLPNLLSPKASLRRSPSSAGTASPAPGALERCGRGSCKRLFIFLIRRPTEFLDLTSLTLDEFQQLVPPFEAAFQAHMAAWRLDGKPRTARQFSVYKNCPLPTPEDRLLFILAYVKTYSL